MITNGILLDKYIELVKDNDMDLLISLAGDIENNKHRV